MKSRDGKSQRSEDKKKRRPEERERVRRRKIQVREKVGKSRNIVFVEWFEAPEGWKVGSLKRRVQSQLLASWDVERVHAIAARSTFPKAKCTKHTMRSDHLVRVEMSKKDHFWELRCRKKCTPLWPEAHFEVKMRKILTRVSEHFWSFRCRKSARRGRRGGHCAPCQNVSKTCRDFVVVSKTMAGVGHLKRIWKDVVSRGRRKYIETHGVRCVRRSVRRFPSIYHYYHHYTTLHSYYTTTPTRLHSYYTTLHYSILLLLLHYYSYYYCYPYSLLLLLPHYTTLLLLVHCY